jgi:hypothetical protein
VLQRNRPACQMVFEEIDEAAGALLSSPQSDSAPERPPHPAGERRAVQVDCSSCADLPAGIVVVRC